MDLVLGCATKLADGIWLKCVKQVFTMKHHAELAKASGVRTRWSGASKLLRTPRETSAQSRVSKSLNGIAADARFQPEPRAAEIQRVSESTKCEWTPQRVASVLVCGNAHSSTRWSRLPTLGPTIVATALSYCSRRDCRLESRVMSDDVSKSIEFYNKYCCKLL